MTGVKIQEAMAANETYNIVQADPESTIEQIREAKKYALETREEAEEAIAELAKLQANAIIDMVNNIQNYFTRVNNFFDSVSNTAKGLNDYMTNTFGLLKTSADAIENYGQSIDSTRNKFDAITAEI